MDSKLMPVTETKNKKGALKKVMTLLRYSFSLKYLSEENI
jgi:hypothetical protein